MDYLLSLFAISIGFNLIVFLIAYFLKTDRLTDFTYALTFVLLAGYGINQDGTSWSTLILFGMILLWAIRLGGYLLLRIIKIKKDKRFDQFRHNFWKFGGFWLIQGVTVAVVSLASGLFFQNPATDLGFFSIFGIFVFASGLLIETAADWQKFQFKQNPKNQGKWIESGLWSISRHPNYVGEILVWTGVWLFSLSALSGWQIWLGLLSPIYIACLILFVSGVPLLEKSADKRWGKLAAYQQYKQRVGVMLPRDWPALVGSIFLAQAAGAIGSIFTVESVQTWYQFLNKPTWSPPNWLFGPVWLSLYTLMGTAAYLIWRTKASGQLIKLRRRALILYGLHLIFNTLWSILFFGWRRPDLAFFEILFLWLMILLMMIWFGKIKKVASWLLLPYLLWVTFASWLNFNILLLN